MKATVLYHPNSEHGGTIERYVKDFEERNGRTIQLGSLETREGAAMASLYDITTYPALLIMTDDGMLQKVWQGSQMPLMDEVSGYLVA